MVEMVDMAGPPVPPAPAPAPAAPLLSLSRDLMELVCRHMRGKPRRSASGIDRAWYRVWHRAADDRVGRPVAVVDGVFRWSYGLVQHASARHGWCSTPSRGRTRAEVALDTAFRTASVRQLAQLGHLHLSSAERVDVDLEIARGVTFQGLVVGRHCLLPRGIDLASFPHLTWLDISDQGIGEQPGQLAELGDALARMTHLTHLDLTLNDVGLIDSIAALRLDRLDLRTLVLDCNPLLDLHGSAADLAAVLDRQPRLTRLELHDVDLHTDPLPVLAAIGRRTGLVRLDMAENALCAQGETEVAVALIAALVPLASLRELHLSGNYLLPWFDLPPTNLVARLECITVGSVGMHATGPIKWLEMASPAMTSVDFVKVDARCHMPQLTGALHALPALRRVNLEGCMFGEQAAVVALLDGLPAGLETLCLANTAVLAPKWRATGARAISRLTTLKTLHLDHCSLGYGDSKPLVDMLGVLGALTNLDVSHNGFDAPVGLVRAMRALPIRRLDMSHNALGGVFADAELPVSLTELHLDFTGITGADAARIAGCPRLLVAHIKECAPEARERLRHILVQ